MRVVLLYPPPWKIPDPGQSACLEDGPPEGYLEGDLDPDFHQIPYGLLSLAAQALRAGHHVKVLNLSRFSWSTVERTLDALRADVFGLSCWTANRRGVDLVSRQLRLRNPSAQIVVGGPHATPLAAEVLRYYSAVDTVCVGESEETFLELLACLESGRVPRGLAGTFYREADGSIAKGPTRRSIADLDSLAAPQSYFSTHILMTSRGCPWQCTFCGAETTWGRGFRGRSVPQVLDDIEAALQRLPVRMLQIKDDTFTANRKRAMQICKGILERKLNFVWSCDTRVDVLSDELLRTMRQAGCQRLSLGVESGSPEILRRIDKKISVEQIEASTRLARRYGIQVRYYMMLGNRGETLDTFQQTLSFLDRAQPHQYIFSCLSIYPGTVDFHDALAAGWLERTVYFEEKFQELKVPFDAEPGCERAMAEWFRQNKGLQVGKPQTLSEARAVCERLPRCAPALLDLAVAYYRAGDYQQAKSTGQGALQAGHPAPGLVLNLMACVAYAQGDVRAMQDHFMEAARRDPQHFMLMANVERARQWFRTGAAARGDELQLHVGSEFELFERTTQPTLPGPLPEDYASWGASPTAASTPAQGTMRRNLPVA